MRLFPWKTILSAECSEIIMLEVDHINLKISACQHIATVFVVWVSQCLCCSLTGITSHNSNHPVDGAQLPPANPVKPESVQSNGPSNPLVEAAPPIPDNNSNGCSQSTASHDRNGSLEPPVLHRDTAVVAHDRPAKRCRTEAEPLGQSELEPSRAQENWKPQSSVELTYRCWFGVDTVSPASPCMSRRMGWRWWRKWAL